MKCKTSTALPIFWGGKESVALGSQWEVWLSVD